MKTITLTEDAYERLKSWKDGTDSFSAVVMRVVPKRGTAADMSIAFNELPRPTDEEKAILEDALRKATAA